MYELITKTIPMNHFLRLKHFLLIAVITSLTFSCDVGDDTPITSENIVAVAQNANLSSLVSALDSANLTAVLETNGPFTVLAPSNAAFDTFLSANGFSSLDEVPVELLTEVLLNHVLSGSITSSTLTGLGVGYATTLATTPASSTGVSIYFDTSSGVRFNNQSSVTQADIPCLLYTSPSPRDRTRSRMPSSA